MRKSLFITVFLSLSILLQECRSGYIDRANQQSSVCASKSYNTCDWMSELMREHPEVALTDICLPGSHDAGMYTTQHCTAFTNYGNTQTQYLTFKNQLESGVRIFDLRPWLYKDELYAHHSTKCDGLGCKGGSLKEILSDTRQFTDKHAEIVILRIGHWCHTSPEDTAYISLVTSILGDRIYREDPAHPMSDIFIKTPLKEIVPAGSKTGKVILLMEEVQDNPANRAKGWMSERMLLTAGGWSNDNHLEELQQHQLARFAKYPGNGNALYELCWQITQHDAQAVRGAFDPYSPTTIRKGAVKANAALPIFIESLITTGSIHKGRIPNIIWADLADTMLTHQALRLTGISVK